jgi:hypothetical protein
MSSQPIQYLEEREESLIGLQGELLEALLLSEEEVYPWNPAEPEAETFFAELERGFLLDCFQEEEEVNIASQALFERLHKCWDKVSSEESSVVSASDSLSKSLFERFGQRVPTAWLETISNIALEVVHSNLSAAQQMVQCIKPLLSNWHEEDLLVLARPVAYAMRGNLQPAQEEIPNVVPTVDWNSLSQKEQISLSLVVAQAALTQLQNPTDNSDN